MKLRSSTILPTIILPLAVLPRSRAGTPEPRLLLFDHFSNALSVEWCGGHLTGGSFVPGKVFRALRLQGGTLHYRTHQSYTARPESIGWQHFDVNRGTLRFWLKPEDGLDDGRPQTLFYTSASGGRADTFLLRSEGRGTISFVVTDPRGRSWTASGRPKVKAGEWTLFEVAWETGVGKRGSISLRIDGKELAAERGALTVGRMGPEMWLGSRAGAEPVRGILDELRVWDRPLPPQPVSPAAKEAVVGLTDEEAHKLGLLFYHRFDSKVSCDPDGYAGGKYPVVIKGGGGESRPGAAGKFGYAARISGPARGSLQFRSDGHFDKKSGTVAMWFKPSQSLLDNWGHLFAEHYRLCDLFVSGKRFSFQTPSGRLGSKFQGLEADEWVHVAATWDLATGRSAIYVNGILDAAHQGDPAELPTQSVFHIGGDEHSRQSRRGVYDEFRIYNRPLSAEEVRRLADEEIQPPPFEY